MGRAPVFFMKGGVITRKVFPQPSLATFVFKLKDGRILSVDALNLNHAMRELNYWYNIDNEDIQEWDLV